jgi:hypothetical protein
VRFKLFEPFAAALILVLAHPYPSAGAGGLSTVERTFHSYAAGDQTCTCLAIDGGIVPLIPPRGGDFSVQGGDGAAIIWPEDDTIARIRSATPAEAALANLMGAPEAADAWKRYFASTLSGGGYKIDVHDFQPDVLDVNHWRIGAITMDYSIGGRKSSSLLMIWRCKDGSTLAVTMNSDPGSFKGHYDELSRLIGGAMIMAP